MLSIFTTLTLLCLVGALVFQINSLQAEVEAYKDSCPAVGDHNFASSSLKMEGAIVVSHSKSESKVNKDSTTASTLSFGERPDVIWVNW